MELHELELKSWDLRRDIVDIIMAGGGGHIGGDMSVLNTLLVLYKNHLNITPDTTEDPNRDRFVLSKGHAVEALYAVLADCGFLDLDDIKARFSKFGSPYIGHPNNKLKGIEMNSGSLGHGLPVCVGMALAGKMDKRDYRVYTVMGDGELGQHRGRHEAGQSGAALGGVRLERHQRRRRQHRGNGCSFHRRKASRRSAHRHHRQHHQGLWQLHHGK